MQHYLRPPTLAEALWVSQAQHSITQATATIQQALKSKHAPLLTQPYILAEQHNHQDGLLELLRNITYEPRKANAKLNAQTRFSISPTATLITKSGDCKAQSILAVAHIRYNNTPARLICPVPNHMAIQIHDNGWHTFDATKPSTIWDIPSNPTFDANYSAILQRIYQTQQSFQPKLRLTHTEQ